MFKFLSKKPNQDNSTKGTQDVESPSKLEAYTLENCSLKSQIELLKIEKQEQYESFIAILNQIQEFNNNKAQWKHRQLQINNAINLAKESYEQKIKELD